MPFAHTCASCGLSLAHLPAPLDPHYRLPIVVCPECGVACTRRADAHRPVPRAVLLARQALITLMANTLWTLLLAAAVAGASYGLALELRRGRLDLWSLPGMLAGLRPRSNDYLTWIERDGPVALVLWSCLMALTGAYLAAALPHLRRRVLVPIFAATVVVLLFLPSSLELLDRLASPHRSTPLTPETLSRSYAREIRTLGVLPAAALVALIGVPIGRRAGRMHAAVQAASRRRLRARIRKRRLAS